MHVKEVRKSGNQIKKRDKEYKLSDFDTQKNKIVEELKKAKYNDLEDLVYRMQLTNIEIAVLLDLKVISIKRTGYSLNPGIYEVADLNDVLKHILPDNVKINIIIDDIRLKSSLKNIQTLLLTEMSFFYTILDFTRSRSYPLDDIDGFYQFIAG